jgi:hypothetical protein
LVISLFTYIIVHSAIGMTSQKIRTKKTTYLLMGTRHGASINLKIKQFVQQNVNEMYAKKPKKTPIFV